MPQSCVVLASQFSCPFSPSDPPDVLVALQDQVRNESDTVQLFCQFSGLPAPLVEWTVMDRLTGEIEVLASSERVSISETSSFSDVFLTSSTITIDNLEPTDEAGYNCTGKNGVTNFIAAVDYSSAFITVQGMDRVVSCPQIM